MAGSAAHLASPQVHEVKFSSVSMSGEQCGGVTNRRNRDDDGSWKRAYKQDFYDQLAALFQGRDVIGITELNGFWFS